MYENLKNCFKLYLDAMSLVFLNLKIRIVPVVRFLDCQAAYDNAITCLQSRMSYENVRCNLISMEHTAVFDKRIFVK